MTCKEIPAMNDIYVIDLDEEACFDDHLMGGTNEMTRTTCANGDHMWEMNDPKKGVGCKLFYEKFTCMDGTWKPVCIEGAEEFAKPWAPATNWPRTPPTTTTRRSRLRPRPAATGRSARTARSSRTTSPTSWAKSSSGT